MDKKLWHKILDIIKSEVSPTNFRGWFGNVSFSMEQENQIKITVASAFFKEQLSLRYLSLIEKAAQQVLGQKPIIEFFIDASKANKSTTPTQIEEADLFQIVQSAPIHMINPKYTLENFVVGLSNNVAYAAAQAVVQNPGSSYNPLFIYGGTGVGKTHLMLGIGNAILSKNPHYKVIYCASEKFTNDYVESIQTRKMGDLRAKYRSADLLLVDDVQFFSGREGTQEEFFHTFNELTAKNGQIILTSDRPPREMPKLEERLKSRFQGGLMVDIQQPDFDTRVAILKAKCQERGETLPAESLNLIAASLETNSREIEGKLIQIVQVLKTQNLPPTPDNIRPLLGQNRSDLPVKITYKQVINSVCTYFNIKHSELTGPKRQKQLVLSRHMIMYILSEDLKLTVERIGEILGGRDHTTVMHGRDRIKKLLDIDREVQRIFSEVKQVLLQ